MHASGCATPRLACPVIFDILSRYSFTRFHKRYTVITWTLHSSCRSYSKSIRGFSFGFAITNSAALKELRSDGIRVRQNIQILSAKIYKIKRSNNWETNMNWTRVRGYDVLLALHNFRQHYLPTCEHQSKELWSLVQCITAFICILNITPQCVREIKCFLSFQLCHRHLHHHHHHNCRDIDNNQLNEHQCWWDKERLRERKWQMRTHTRTRIETKAKTHAISDKNCIFDCFSKVELQFWSIIAI